jgi:poly(beta-D-mannuronate) lyase
MVCRRCRLLLVLMVLAHALPAAADTYRVASLADLQARINAALPGDVILVKDGTYTTTAPITIDRKGLAGKPIRIAAQARGNVAIEGSDGFDVIAGAAHIEIDGFRFSHASGKTQIRPGATHVRFTRNVFECQGDGAYLTIAGDDAEVDRNELRNKRTVGNMIDVRGAGSQVAQRVRIHHNYFHDFTSPGPGTNGAETIRFGLSGLSMSKGLGVIEHNLFVRCTGENEMLSIKSSSNIIQDNTLLDSPGAQLTLRHGNDNIVRRNYLRGTDGIRIFGDRNRVSDNYLEANTGAIQIGNGGAEVADGAPLTSHDRPDDTYITSNVLLNNRRNIFMTARDKGLGATRVTIAHNTIQGGGPAAHIEGPVLEPIWRDNTVWDTPAGLMPETGFTKKQPTIKPLKPLTVEDWRKFVADATSSRRSVLPPRPSSRQSRTRGTARRRRSRCAGCSQSEACAPSAGAA